jgi:hypothetical protein
MNNNVSNSSFHENIGHGAKHLKNIFRSIGFVAAVFASLGAVLTSGCASLPHKAIVAGSVSTESGYPNVPIKRDIAPAIRSERVLPVKPASISYLGRAEYICTPSGFGRTSGCFLRKS